MINHNNGILKNQLNDFIVKEKINFSFSHKFHFKFINSKDLLINNLSNILSKSDEFKNKNLFLSVSYTNFRDHETVLVFVCRLLLEKQ